MLLDWFQLFDCAYLHRYKHKQYRNYLIFLFEKPHLLSIISIIIFEMCMNLLKFKPANVYIVFVPRMSMKST